MWYRLPPHDSRRQIGHRCWGFALWLVVLLLPSAPARAHDLAIDQVMLWPDRETGTLRGELTFDPELTRSKDARPSEEYARRAVEFLSQNLEVTLDDRAAPLAFEVRELWVRGGATLGDVVTFSTPLPASVRELRVRARAFDALVVSVQRVQGAPSSAAPPRVDTTSWLLAANDRTPAYALDTGWQAPGWRSGGPDVFTDSVASASPGAVHPSAAGAVATGAPSGDEATRDASPARLAARFIQLGFEHILPGGIDHVLFVAGLVLARARRYRQVLISLSLFTLAHTLTLALGKLQLVQVPSQVVEPLIALSIFVLGVDNLRASRSADAPASLRYLIVFCFGLVHGLGFASALSELAFDRDHVVLALFSFNLGVELGQVAVVALLALLLASIQRWRTLERYATLAGSAAIAAAGLFMVVDRVTHREGTAGSARVPALVTATPFLSAPPHCRLPHCPPPESRPVIRSL